jgi:hypothetical protein
MGRQKQKQKETDLRFWTFRISIVFVFLPTLASPTARGIQYHEYLWNAAKLITSIFELAKDCMVRLPIEACKQM